MGGCCGKRDGNLPGNNSGGGMKGLGITSNEVPKVIEYIANFFDQCKIPSLYESLDPEN